MELYLHSTYMPSWRAQGQVYFFTFISLLRFTVLHVYKALKFNISISRRTGYWSIPIRSAVAELLRNSPTHWRGSFLQVGQLD